MSLARKAVIFTIAWFLIYLVAYFVFIAPSLLSKGQLSSSSQDKLSKSRPTSPNAHLQRIPQSLTDPFIPSDCPDIGGVEMNVGVIIAVHDEKPHAVIQTVKSVLENSEDVNLKIVIVDDHSIIPVREWDEWGSLLAKIQVIRTSKHVGVSESRNYGVKSLPFEIEAIIFLDSGAIVSEGFASPLLDTLRRHPHAVVYPGVDVLDDLSSSMLQASNAVAALDWSLRMKWEDLDSKSPREISERLPLLPQHVAASDEVASPVAPSTFAIKRDFLDGIGGLATTSLLSPWGPSHIELSLRVWMCTDGLVIRQPCSRVAVRRCVDQRQNEVDGSTSAELKICPDSGTENGYTQREGDKDAMSLAALWLGSEYREDVSQHRLTGRLPYTIRMRSDSRHPDFIASAKNIDVEKCSNFDWYLKKIYSGLQVDRASLKKTHTSSSSVQSAERMLSSLLKQYEKGGKKNEAAYELSASTEQKSKSIEDMKFRIRDQNLCANVDDKMCDAVKQAGECTSKMAENIFKCPKTCGFCSDDNHLCTDFYLKKCPEQAANGDCTNPEKKDFMETNCRRSCKLCRRPEDPPLIKADTSDKRAEEDLLANAVRISPYVAQEQWIAGKLPDPFLYPTCALQGTRHAVLLDHLHVTPDPPEGFLGNGDVSKGTTNAGNRVFCATYTMEKNHQTNVATMKASWTKRCDGWVAFSTVDDPSIPALRIYHEGPEEYNNMWQKSRSIWKYIAHHYIDEFDWFLIGGDDMYYIMSNLRAYLSSPEIQNARSEGKGLFLGRKFSPPNQIVFNSGGAGYILDRASLQVLAEHIDGPPCFPHQKGFWEDVNVASCLLKTKNIVPYDTRDTQKRERFHPFTPGNHLDYRIPKNPDWYAKYNPELKTGFDCCATDSISFHYAKADFMTKMHNYLYNCDVKKDIS